MNVASQGNQRIINNLPLTSSNIGTQLKTYLILLNNPYDTDLLIKFRKQTSFFIVADGGANRLRKAKAQELLRPDIILGDLDSISQDTLDYYRSQNVTIENRPSQDDTDMEKSFIYLLERIGGASSDIEERIIVFGGFGGRLDHTLSNLSVLSKYARELESKRKNCQIMMVDPFAVAHVILPGVTRIRPNPEIEEFKVGVGLFPLEGTPDFVKTTGLKWNLGEPGQPQFKFGSFISSSNQITQDEVVIENSDPILFTTTLKSAAEYLQRRVVHTRDLLHAH